MSDEVKTAEEIAQDYTAMGHSVELINGIIDGSKMADEEAAERQNAVDRNVEHLELCLLYTSPSPRDRQKSRMPSSA